MKYARMRDQIETKNRSFLEGEKMKLGIVEFLSQIGRTSGLKPHGSGFKAELARVFSEIIEAKMAKGNSETALGVFKTVLILDSRPDLIGFAERVLESAPIFAALVAKMNIDEMVAKFNLEREKAKELKTLAEKYAQETKRVQPI